MVLAGLLVTEFWSHALAGSTTLASPAGVGVALATLAAPLALFPATRMLAFAGLAVAEVAAISESFPWTGNHRYFELFLCLFAAVLDLRVPEERRVFLRAVQWLTVVVLFYSGLQKLAHGFYVGGHYLAYMLHEETYRPVLGLLLPADELARLSALPRAVGSGPYVVESTWFITASNLVWIAEMSLPVLLVWPATRRLGVVGTFVLLLAIEAAARELFFGLLFAGATLTFWPTPVLRRLAPVFLFACAFALLVRAGWLPEVGFH